MSTEINIGDLVWAKMKGFSPWPARIVNPGPDTKKPPKKTGYRWVYFFGTGDNAWIEDRCIQSYQAAKEKYNKNKSATFKVALAKIEEFIVKKNEDPDYEPEEVVAPAPVPVATQRKSPSVPKKKPVKRKSTSPTASASASNSTSGSTRKKKRTFLSEENGDFEYDPIKSLYDSSEESSSTRVNLSHISDAMKNKDISASTLAFGFIGLGNMGSGMVKNLINSGHHVNLYSRQSHKCEEIKTQADLTKSGLVNVYTVPCDVVQNSDIIFCCISDHIAAKEIVYGNCGILYGSPSLEGKGYVEMTGIDSDTSKVISEAITSHGGRYLEAQVQGSKKEADEGTLIILTGGDQTLFDDCQTSFKAMGKTAFYLGDVGYATKMNLVLNMMKGVSLVGFAEAFALADKAGLSPSTVLEIFNLTTLASPYLKEKAEMIVRKEFNRVQQSLTYMQKDMKLALDLSDSCKQPLSMAAVANEVYKHACRLGYGNCDCACVYIKARH